MTKSDKFINPFTDFGFKKLFGEEENKDLLIAFLNTLLPVSHRIVTLQHLSEIPVELRDGVFKKLFQVADMANLSKEERQDYITSLKYYRDMKNVIASAFEEGVKKGRELWLQKNIETGRAQERLTLARQLKQMGMADAQIVQVMGLSLKEIGALV